MTVFVSWLIGATVGTLFGGGLVYVVKKWCFSATDDGRETIVAALAGMLICSLICGGVAIAIFESTSS